MKFSSMEENLHKDNLESLFKQRFEDLPDSPAPDGWDTPSEEVWDKIAVAAPGGGGWLSYSWQKLIVGIFLLGLTGAAVFFWNQNKNLKQQVRLQASEIELLNEEIQYQESADEDSALDGAQTNKQTLTPEKPTQRISISSDGLSQNNPLISKDNALTVHPENDKTDFSVNEFVTTGTQSDFSATGETDENGIVENITPDAVKATVLPLEESSREPLRNVPYLRGLMSSLELPARDIAMKPLPVVSDNKPVIPVKSVGFFVGAYAAPNFTSSHTKSSMGPLLFRSFEKESWSPERGFKAGVVLNGHWKISTGIGFYDAALTSRQRFRIDYDQTIETQVGEDYESTYSLSVPTSYGNTDLEVDFRRSSSDQINQGQHVLLDVIARQRLKFINIPLMVGYETGKGRFSYGVQTGAAINILNTTVVEAEVTSKSMKLRRHNNKPRITRQLTETRRVGYDYLLGASIGYHLSPSLRLSVEPVFRTNITPVVSTEDFSNSLNSFSLHIGANYMF